MNSWSRSCILAAGAGILTGVLTSGVPSTQDRLATPATITAVIKATKAGDSITCDDGAYTGGVKLFVKGVTIRALHTGKAVFVGGTNCLEIAGGDDTTVEGLVFRNAAHDGLYVHGAARVHIHDCKSFNSTDQGIMVSGCPGAIVEDCEVGFVKQQHALYMSGCDNTTVRGCFLHDATCCLIQFNGQGHPGGVTGGLAENNHLVHGGGAGNGGWGIGGGSAINCELVHGTAAKPFTVRNNLIEGCTAGGIAFFAGSSDCRAEGNTVLFLAGQGRACVSATRAQRVSVVGNTLQMGRAGDATQTDDPSSVTASDNTVKPMAQKVVIQ